MMFYEEEEEEKIIGVYFLLLQKQIQFKHLYAKGVEAHLIHCLLALPLSHNLPATISGQFSCNFIQLIDINGLQSDADTPNLRRTPSIFHQLNNIFLFFFCIK